MTTRTIAQIENASIEMVGTNRVKRALPTRNLKQVDPFIFIDHLIPVTLAPEETMRIPPHPHAGFEVVTYLLDGEFFHRDSYGHNQVASGGDVNWMTSGSGIIHSEGPTADFLREGGRLELMQVWINLPAEKKGIVPSFRHFPSGVLPVVENELLRVKIIIGEYGGKTSPVSTHTPMFYYHLEVKKGTLVILPVNENFSSALYLLSGKIQSLQETAKAGDLVNYETNGNQLVFTALEDSSLIAFGGEPIKEKVVSYGPFVMNSFEEIQEAMQAYETGKMGVLEY